MVDDSPQSACKRVEACLSMCPTWKGVARSTEFAVNPPSRNSSVRPPTIRRKSNDKNFPRGSFARVTSPPMLLPAHNLSPSPTLSTRATGSRSSPLRRLMRPPSSGRGCEWRLDIRRQFPLPPRVATGHTGAKRPLPPLHPPAPSSRGTSHPRKEGRTLPRLSRLAPPTPSSPAPHRPCPASARRSSRRPPWPSPSRQAAGRRCRARRTPLPGRGSRPRRRADPSP